MAVLKDVRDAICAGEQTFLYTLDSMGTVAWGYPLSALQTSDGTPARDFPTDPQYDFAHPWKVAYGEQLSYAEFVVDGVLRGTGRGDCPALGCYDPSYPIPVPITDGPRLDCCLPQQTRVPSIVGGVFSLVTKNRQDVQEANALCAARTKALTARTCRRPARYAPPRRWWRDAWMVPARC